MMIAPAIVAAAVWFAPARAEDGVVLRAALSQGQSLRYDVEAKLGSQSGIQKEPESLDQHLRVRFTVVRVDKDGALLRGRLESLKVRAKRLGEEAAEFEWKEGDEPVAAEGDAPPLAKMYRLLAGTIFEVSLDEHGAVESVSGLDRVLIAGKGLANPSRTMGILAPEAAARMLQGVFTLDTEGHPRSVGDSWTLTQEISAGAWPTKVQTEYTLKSLAGGVAGVVGRTTILPPQVKEGDAATPRVEVTAQSVSTEAAWDVKHSRLLSRITDGSVTWKATIPIKQPIEATNTSTTHVVFRFVPGPKNAPENPEK